MTLNKQILKIISYGINLLILLLLLKICYDRIAMTSIFDTPFFDKEGVINVYNSIFGLEIILIIGLIIINIMTFFEKYWGSIIMGVVIILFGIIKHF